MPPQENWHLDKKIPISLIVSVAVLFLGLIGQTIVMTSWLAAKFEQQDNRLANLEKSDTNKATHDNRITILETQFAYIRGDLAEIKDLLRRRVPDPQEP